MLRWLAFLSVISLVSLIAAEPCSAEIKTITATGEYRMGDNDTRIIAKQLALQDAKRLALERVGTYLESVTEVKSFGVARDELNAYTAGIVEVTELSTKDVLEGITHIIRVEVTAKIDTSVVARQIDALRKNERAKAELMKVREDRDQLRQEVETKTRELASLKSRDEAATIAKQRQQLIVRVLVKEANSAYLFHWFEVIERTIKQTGSTGGNSIYTPDVVSALSRAKQLVTVALALDPSSHIAQHLMASVLVSEGEYLVATEHRDAAINNFKQASRLEPTSELIHGQVASQLMKLGELEGALTEIQLAISLQPKRTINYIILGDIFVKMGETDKGIAAFKKVIQLAPSSVLGHGKLSDALRKNGLNEEAERELNVYFRLMEENQGKCKEVLTQGKDCDFDTGQEREALS